MGYTNYYRTPAVMDKEKFKTLAEELLVATGFLPGNKSSASLTSCDGYVSLFGGNGTGEPIFNEDLICFNGDASKGYNHETFYIERVKDNPRVDEIDENGLVFDFCKTARKPYDLMAQISMLRLKHHFPECKISSDGDAKDWKNGKDLYKKIFGETAPKLERD
jgi:hypothetical protein